VEIGIGIPNSVPGTSGEQLLEWARRADRAGFSALATIGAVSFPSYEELTVLGAAAAVTERIRLFPNVLIAPARSSAELAKQALTVDHLSGGRLSLGLGVGWRETDYILTGRDFTGRGEYFEQQLRDLRTACSGEPLAEGTEPVGPRSVQQPGIPILVGGNTEAAIRRAAQHGDGFTIGGAPPDAAKAVVEQVHAAWKEAGRDEAPKVTVLNYFGLGDTEEESRGSLLAYYAPRGQEVAEMVAGSAHRDPRSIEDTVEAMARAGVDEFFLDATVSDPEQVDLLAEVVF
jgi:alkanesulfonate monooxygenase SsuD/methylene tetrahydromethanopterin reductase-like flavin-dependent oxidoreductase (luciferase family)